MHRRPPAGARLAILVSALFLGFVAPAAAQLATNASIVGRVSDESGAILPGVTVSARSASLQVSEATAVTDGKGEYRLIELPPGLYVVTYALQGFQSVRHDDIRLVAGFVATLNARMSIGTVSETVTVRGQSPIVDVNSTTTSTQFLREQLEAIPTSGNSLRSLLIQAPGVRSNLDVGGSGTGSRRRRPSGW